ncbi:VanZ like family protein [Gracilibacillus orientalis]|uniref:VanZ like family protein n=1 Tax=Gracilibacillus orientalis TaxID=334253 RepID=A0A1I4ITN2_9BACI|nr:VanZ family protein [Gracilibacillus orientalis]SFL57729.1 VanZ like family protein [Gracilibacillus orientalis]
MYLIEGSIFMALGMILYLVGRGILIGIRYKNNKQIYWLKESIGFLFMLYICMVVPLTLFPIPVGFAYDLGNNFHSLNLIPLKLIIDDISQIGIAYGGDVPFMIRQIARNVGGNILLLMPLAFLAPILWDKFKSFRRILLLGFGVSISIEIVQFIGPTAAGWGRVTDIDDVILNVLGVMIGYLIYKLTFKIVDTFQIGALQKLNAGLIDNNN